MNFWHKLKKPISCLAPMEDVTDVAFRSMISKYGKPDIVWTEFVSADGLDSVGQNNLLHKLKYSEIEKPIVAQFFSTNPQKMYKASKMAVKLGFDGIDINMGCPDRNICKQGAGAAIIKTPKLAQEIIKATQDGAGDIPVSVKTRVGFNKNELETWLPNLLEIKPVAVTIHARTRKEMSKVPANWDLIKRSVEIRDELSSKSLIIGNGDVESAKDGEVKTSESGCDGYMVGRGILGNPWFWSGKEDISVEEKIRVMSEHLRLFDEFLSEHLNYAVMKKHLKAYTKGFDGAKELRVMLMDTKSSSDAVDILENWNCG